ncbi:MAG TPA: 4Fe-4S binding protein [Firmicutes bacterium]|nr:4Fe-4S binding protein [Bacillota bacterium]
MEKWISPIGEQGIYEIDTGKWRTYRPVIDASKCTGCGVCAFYCPVAAVKRQKNASGALTIDLGYCKGCGICTTECPRRAITMVREEDN